jgi:diadenosine tetraphosphate (Ap4A) HIT family hydrolase
VKIVKTVNRYPTALVTVLFFCLTTILVSAFPAWAEEFVDATAEYDPHNVFARILRGEAPAEIVFENEYALAFHDIAPRSKVHVLIIPKGPYANFMRFNADASDAEKLGLLDAIGQTAIIMGVNESGFRLLSNTGQHGKQTVPHLHVHLRGGESVH